MMSDLSGHSRAKKLDVARRNASWQHAEDRITAERDLPDDLASDYHPKILPNDTYQDREKHDRVDRLFGILLQLQQRRRVRAQDLATIFEVSERTIYRDITAMIDYVVHHRKANGKLVPKVFKLAKKRLDPHETLRLTKRHAFRPLSTRVYYPGRHALELQINGRRSGWQEFELVIQD
jgi:hypothetical protein